MTRKRKQKNGNERSDTLIAGEEEISCPTHVKRNVGVKKSEALTNLEDRKDCVEEELQTAHSSESSLINVVNAQVFNLILTITLPVKRYAHYHNLCPELIKGIDHNGSMMFLDIKAGSSTRRRLKKFRLSLHDFLMTEKGDRVLSCGEGEQLGHPGRIVTRKPRAICTLPEGKLITQVVAGGVHSLVLMEDGTVYGCGINEKGTVPGEGVGQEETIDVLTPIKFNDSLIQQHGKVVMLTAGASFSAALTEKGSVVAWGNIRGMSGCIESHETLLEMEKHPVIIVQHQQKVIVKIAAGENHLVMLTENGEVLTFGDGSVGQLGRCSRVSNIRSRRMVSTSPDSLKISVYDKKKKKLVVFNNIMAGGYWTAAHSIDGTLYVCGLNNFGQLGVPIPEFHEEKGNEPELKIMHPVKATAFEKRVVVDISGIQHVLALTAEGKVYGIGKNTDNALGLGTWSGKEDGDHWKYSELQNINIPGIVRGVSASLGCSIIWTDNGDAYSWGYDSSGQLGLGIKDDDDKMIPEPQKITSVHLDGYRIIGVSLADNHALFLAKKLIK
ncbi:unnamed protein product [Thelazia callipaeda]|uniref:Regulator of chromosome condensation n=1 Tax=Thelazia callipaeda TaxID=103827 RepID=A0A0N5D6F9_THECL|nr:unnamed protein product [Thelazia callipaeda]